MGIVAHGIDLVDIDRIEQILDRHGRQFLDRIFTVAEQDYACSGRNSSEKLAGRFAAKEAVLKLIGTGWRGKIAWTDIEILNNAMGCPYVNLTGEVERIARGLGITKVSISITHTSSLAAASAVALAD